MCGIVGVVNCKKSVISRMVDRLSHRGPDNKSYSTFKNFQYGHTRLSIVDLSKAANQPFVSKCNEYEIIYNGEVYNHLNLRKDHLKQQTFRTTSDTETILQLYIEIGIEFLELLDGIFSFCILDKKKGDLIIARDIMGVKPLYIYQKEDVFSFSSEIKSFLEIPNFDKTINYQALAHYVSYQYTPSQETPFKYVNKLEKGACIIYSITGKQKNHHFGINNFSENEIDKKDAEILLDKLLSESIKKQHLSDVPVGYLLSGGIDSTSVLHYSKESNKNLNAFTIDDNGRNCDEGFESDLLYAKLVADSYKANLSISNPIDVVDSLDKIIYHLDEPLGDTSVLSLYQICREAKNKNYKVLLSGLGADDIFSGYRRHQALAYQHFKKAFHFVSTSIFPKNLKRKLEKFRERIPNYYRWLSYSEVNKLFETKIQSKLRSESQIDRFWNTKTGLGDLNKMLNIEQQYYLPHNNLLYSDKIGMAFGVEIRVPFLDSNVVNFANRLPEKLKLNSLTTKYILRRL